MTRSTSAARSPDGASVSIVTADSDAGRHVLRHSTAHVLAQAVTRLFPGAKYTIGPAIENGFYYDFDVPGGAHVHGRRPRGDRGRDAPDRRRGPAVRALGAVRPRTRRPSSPTSRTSARSSSGPRPPRPTRSTRARSAPAAWSASTGTRPSSSTSASAPTCPPRAASATSSCRRWLGRVLAGRREAADAPADLRHGVGERRGAEGAPPPPGGGREARPPQAGRRARPAELPRGARRRPRRVASEGRHRAQAHGGLQPRPPPARRLPVRLHAPPRRRPGCSRRAATSTGTPTACTRRWRWTTASTTRSR